MEREPRPGNPLNPRRCLLLLQSPSFTLFQSPRPPAVTNHHAQEDQGRACRRSCRSRSRRSRRGQGGGGGRGSGAFPPLLPPALAIIGSVGPPPSPVRAPPEEEGGGSGGGGRAGVAPCRAPRGPWPGWGPGGDADRWGGGGRRRRSSRPAGGGGGCPYGAVRWGRGRRPPRRGGKEEERRRRRWVQAGEPRERR